MKTFSLSFFIIHSFNTMALNTIKNLLYILGSNVRETSVECIYACICSTNPFNSQYEYQSLMHCTLK